MDSALYGNRFSLPILALKPGRRAQTLTRKRIFRKGLGKVSGLSGPMRSVHLMHKRPSPVLGRGGGLCIDTANIHAFTCYAA